MSPTTAPRRPRRPRGRRALPFGFTLVELMVSLTGGLFVMIAVFMLAKHGSRFYQQESRVANATLGSVLGFERLRADLARAGFLSTPNVRKDPQVCGRPDGTWPLEMGRLASVRITVGGSPNAPTLAANGLDPDELVLSGSYASVEQFPIQRVVDVGTGYNVYLAEQSGAVARIGLTNLAQVFQAGRILRIVDRDGKQHFGAIAGDPAVDISDPAQPFVKLAQIPALTFRQSSSVGCGIRGNCTGCVASAVSVIKYDVRNLATGSNFGGANPGYAPVYADGAAGPFDDDRTELVRVELNATTGGFMAGTEEIVAEYAVDFATGLTVADVSGDPQGIDPVLLAVAPGTGAIANWAGDVTGITALNRGPQFIRTVRARLSTRSREGDRRANVMASGTSFVPGAGTLGPGLYRFSLAQDGGVWARVRTVQAEVAMHNHEGALFR